MSKKEQKKILRKRFLEKRSRLSKNTLRWKSKMIEKHVLRFIALKKINAVYSYISYPSEVSTFPLLKKLLSEGKEIFAPRIDTKTKQMKFHRIHNVTRHLQKGTYESMEPRHPDNKETFPQKEDLVLVPGAAFDKRGYRIGYGKGYYDRYLNSINKKALAVGLCCHDFFVDQLPSERHDRRVQVVVTEKGIFCTGAEKSKKINQKTAIKKNDRRKTHTKRAA